MSFRQTHDSNNSYSYETLMSYHGEFIFSTQVSPTFTNNTYVSTDNALNKSHAENNSKRESKDDYDLTKTSLDSLLDYVIEYESLKKDPASFIESYFQEIEREINKRRLEWKQVIDHHYDRLLKELNLYRNNCIHTKKVLPRDKKYDKLKSELKKFISDNIKLDQLNIQVKKSIKEVKRNIKQAQAILLNQKEYKFKNNSTNQSLNQIFGFISCEDEEKGPKEKLNLNAHSVYVNSLAVLDNGDLASCSTDRTIKIWDPLDGSLKNTLYGHFTPIRALAVMPNGDLASGSQDSIRIWNTKNTALKQIVRNIDAWAMTPIASGDLACISYDRNFCVIDVISGTLKYKSHDSKNSLNSLITLSDENIAHGTMDGKIKIWNTRKEKVKAILHGHQSEVLSLAILPHNCLASGSTDLKIIIWDLKRKTLKKVLYGHTDYVTCLIGLPNGNLASGSNNNLIKIWDTEDGSEITNLLGHTDSVKSLVLLKNGCLASCSLDKTIKIWDTSY